MVTRPTSEGQCSNDIAHRSVSLRHPLAVSARKPERASDSESHQRRHFAHRHSRRSGADGLVSDQQDVSRLWRIAVLGRPKRRDVEEYTVRKRSVRFAVQCGSYPRTRTVRTANSLGAAYTENHALNPAVIRIWLKPYNRCFPAKFSWRCRSFRGTGICEQAEDLSQYSSRTTTSLKRQHLQGEDLPEFEVGSIQNN
jgi:hypothetical protein